jgi:hypothetical protein
MGPVMSRAAWFFCFACTFCHTAATGTCDLPSAILPQDTTCLVFEYSMRNTQLTSPDITWPNDSNISNLSMFARPWRSVVARWGFNGFRGFVRFGSVHLPRFKKRVRGNWIPVSVFSCKSNARNRHHKLFVDIWGYFGDIEKKQSLKMISFWEINALPGTLPYIYVRLEIHAPVPSWRPRTGCKRCKVALTSVNDKYFYKFCT